MNQALETVCHRVRLKPNSLEKVYAWANELNNRRSEALATLKDEGVLIESVFLETTKEGDFLIYYMKLKNAQKAKEKFRKSKHAIDEYHKNFQMATWEKGEQLELLVDFERMDI